MSTSSAVASTRPHVHRTQPHGRDAHPVRVLIADNDPALTAVLELALRYEGWEVHVAPDGASALSAAQEVEPDIAVLDVILPDLDGLEVLRRLRAHTEQLPVLFLAAREGVTDRIAGLTAGGDDFVTKPFGIEELVLRLRALLRHSHHPGASMGSIITIDDLSLDEDSHEVRRGGVEIHLTATEFELLRYLMRNSRRVLSKAQILDRVWNYDFGGQPNIVELYISYLRKKVDSGRTPMIHTVRGFGYVLRPSAT